LPIAQRVNEGVWRVKLGLGAEGLASAVVREVTVEPYVLPRFAVDVTADIASGQPYEQGTVFVQADYTFGVALSGGSVQLEGSMGEQLSFVQTGMLSATGAASFPITLPSPAGGRAATLKLVATVTDSAGGQSTGTLNIPIVPEGIAAQAWWGSRGSLADDTAPLYVMLTDPSGAPTSGEVVAYLPNNSQVTGSADGGGLAVVEVPLAHAGTAVSVMATRGADQSAWTTAPAAAVANDLLIKLGAPVVGAGGALTVDVEALYEGPVVIDAYGGGRHVGSVSIDLGALQNGFRTGQGTLTELPGGLVRLVARTVSSHELAEAACFVRSDRQLNVGITAGQSSYRPRELAEVAVTVTDGQGQGAPAALGVTVVDEAVFALTDVSGPVKAFSQGDSVGAPVGLNADQVLSETGDAAVATALLSFSEGAGGFLYVRLADVVRADAAARAAGHVAQDNTDILAAATAAATVENWGSMDGNALYNYLVRAQFKDPWGSTYVLDNSEWGFSVTLRSLGPDEVPSDDDLYTTLYDPNPARFQDTGGGFFPPGAPAAEDDFLAGGGDGAVDGDGDFDSNGGDGDGEGSEPTKVRSEFPETLLVDPMIITDEDGLANVSLPLPDSITTWRVSAVASDQAGRMGTGTGEVVAFQEFFVDLDTPTFLTEGDEIGVLAVINNFLGEEKTIQVTAVADDWGEILSGGDQTVTVPPSSVTGVTVWLRADRVGVHPLQITATELGGEGLSDALLRTVRVKAGGQEVPISTSDRVEGVTTIDVTIPDNATDGATDLLVTLSAGGQTEVVSGLDSMLQQPSGCFEQTSSSTYPNILVLDYLGESGQLSPEIEARARGYIADGYQRLVSFEVDGGGFSWFGEAPAHNVLTAYGLMEFVDMSRVYEVDQALIARTATWLAGQQNADGSFTASTGGIAEGAIDAFTSDVRTTAYLAWALAYAGGHDSEVQSAIAWLADQVGASTDPYALAMYVNLLAEVGDARLPSAASLLAGAATTDDDEVLFDAVPPSALGPCAGDGNLNSQLETTAVAARGLLAGAQQPTAAAGMITHLVRNKDSLGTWQSTQATIRTLQALLATSGSSEPIDASVVIRFDGQEVANFPITDDDATIARIADVSELATPGAHTIAIERIGTGDFTFHVAGRAYLPREQNPPPDPLVVNTSYSSPTANIGEAIDVTTTVTSLTTFEQLLVDIPVPPGFDVELEGLQPLKDAGTISNIEEHPSRVVLYTPGLFANQPLELHYVLRPRLAATVTAPPTVAYAYYDLAMRGESTPVELSSNE
jgi:hypothetical protein